MGGVDRFVLNRWEHSDRREDDNPLDIELPRRFEHVERTFDVNPERGERIPLQRDRIRDCGNVDDHVRPRVRDGVHHARPRFDGAVHDLDLVAVRAEGESPLRGELSNVCEDDSVTEVEQRARNRHADESRTAGDDHRFSTAAHRGAPTGTSTVARKTSSTSRIEPGRLRSSHSANERALSASAVPTRYSTFDLPSTRASWARLAKPWPT